MFSLDTFYQSKQWIKFRQTVINDRLSADGITIDEVTGKPIVKAYDIILHHKIELTEENVNDYNISLNPDNIMIMSHKTHNIIHNKLGYARREIYLVYGAPLSGKTSYVNEIKGEGDLIIDIDSIWECISGCERYVKPDRLKGVVFKVRDTLIECAKYRNGKFNNVYLIGGYPLQSERERLCKTLGAREIFIDCSKEECLQRLKGLDDSDLRKENFESWKKFIDDWFKRYHPPEPLRTAVGSNC